MFDLRSPLAKAVFIGVAFIIGFYLFFPLYWMIISSLKPNAELYQIDPTYFPQAISLEHYRTAVISGDLPLHLRNGMIVSLTSAAFNTLLATYAGYSFARYDYRGRKGVMLFMLSAQMFPFAVLLISIYPMFAAWGLLDSLPGLILSYIVFSLPVGTYMLYSYFSQVPSELVEAARADGASELRIFHTIVLPISIPALVTVFLYSFMWSWNDLLYALTLITSEEKRTVGPGLLLNYLNELNSDWGGAMAASLLASLPVIIGFAFVQKYFIQGVTAGAVK